MIPCVQFMALRLSKVPEHICVIYTVQLRKRRGEEGGGEEN